MGKNSNIHRGILIGQTNREGRQGTPVIGNEVWIGINAAIVGKVTIGDDVLIAPIVMLIAMYLVIRLFLVIHVLSSIGRMQQKDILIGKCKRYKFHSFTI